MTLSAEAVRGRKHGRSGGNMGQVEHMDDSAAHIRAKQIIKMGWSKR